MRFVINYNLIFKIDFENNFKPTGKYIVYFDEIIIQFIVYVPINYVNYKVPSILLFRFL